MPSLKRIEDRPTPSEVYNWKIYGAAITAAFAAVMIGYDSAFIGTTIALTSFKKEFKLQVPSQVSQVHFNNISANIVTVYQAGCFFGAFFGYPAGQLLGRKWGLMLSSLVFCLGAGVMLAADGARGLAPIYAGRVVAGLGIGAASNLTPLYIAEVAPPAIRGQLVGMYEIGWQIGGLVGFWINYGVTRHIPVSNKQWIIPFAVQLIPGGMFAIMIPLFIRESPRWLLSVGRRDEALRSLSYLRGLPADHHYLIEEVNMIDVAIDQERSAVGGAGFWAPFRRVFGTWTLSRRLIITTSLFIWQNGTGINAINYYSPTIFKSIGITGLNTGLLTTGVFGVIKTVGAIVWIFFIVDLFGRRSILMLTAGIGSVAMAVIAGYIGISKPQERPTTTLPPAGIAAMVFFYVWTASYSVGWNGTPWVVNSESFPGAVRQVAQMFAAASNWLFNFVIARATPTMFTNMKGYGPYIFFCLMQLLSIPFVYFLLPETKNIPLEEMDRLWQAQPVRSANAKVMAEIQRERAQPDQHPAFLHQDKDNGVAEHVEDEGEKDGSRGSSMV